MLNFIVNALSGNGLGAKNSDKLIRYLDKNQIQYSMHKTEYAGHAVSLARELIDGGANNIIAVGGDGTFGEVLQGVPDPSVTEIGFIPSGRGNDFAGAMKLPLGPIRALEVILKGKQTFVDYIQVGEKRCLNVAGTGIDIDVLLRVGGRPGKLVYLSSLLYCLKHFEPYSIDVTLPGGETKNYKAIIADICNGTQYGGGLKISPLSVLDDGLLDLIVIVMPENGKILRPLIKFLRGKHLTLPITTHIRCEEVVIHPTDGRSVQLDGEVQNGVDLCCKVVKKGLKTFSPI